jgi:hypothetical protein
MAGSRGLEARGGRAPKLPHPAAKGTRELPGAFPYLRPVFLGSMIPGQLITFLGAFWGASMDGKPFLFRKDREALATRAGEIKLAREQWRCPKCRIVFFR